MLVREYARIHKGKISKDAVGIEMQAAFFLCRTRYLGEGLGPLNLKELKDL